MTSIGCIIKTYVIGHSPLSASTFKIRPSNSIISQGITRLRTLKKIKLKLFRANNLGRVSCNKQNPCKKDKEALLSMEFSRPEYKNGLPSTSPGDLPDPGIEPVSLMSPALAGRFFTPTPHRKPTIINTALSVDSSEPGTGDLDLPSKGCV